MLDEAPLGHYRVASFASQLESGTSGTCLVHDGNIGVFDGSRLVALAYGRVGDEAIGRIFANADGSVRRQDGDIGASPVGDLRQGGDGTLVLSPLAKKASVCGSRGTVLLIRNMSIDKARAALAASGWSPVRASPGVGLRERQLANRGLSEVRSCQDTGLAYCEFSYAGAAGTLSVTTIGDAEMPTVTDYDVRCR